MPNTFLNADIMFPDLLDEEKSTDKKFGEVSNYLYMLLEQLRYTLYNLGADNFNTTELDEISETITDPLYIRLENDEGDINTLKLTAEGLESRISDNEGSISSLTQTASGLSVRVSNAEGSISSLTQTAIGFSARVSNAEGNISTLTQTANGLSVRVSNAEGSISSLTQTIGSMTLSVTNGTNASILELKANGTTLTSGTITFSGVVTFQNLQTAGQTIINGSNIKTGEISAIDIYGSKFYSLLYLDGTIGGEIKMCYADYSFVAGGIRLDTQGAGTLYENQYRMFVYTTTTYGIAFSLKLQSAGGLSMTSGSSVFIQAATTATLAGLTGTIIGAYGTDIYLYGNVYINGVLQ